MAELIGVLGGLLGFVSVTLSNIGDLGDFYRTVVSLSPYTGIRKEIFLSAFFPAALDVMERVERYVLAGDDQAVIGFFKAHTASFTMIGVAGAIIAQVAITALSLDGLAESHWTAEAFFVVSLVTGSLSVFFSCALMPAFHGLHTADDIKDFLTKPIDKSLKKKSRAKLLRNISDLLDTVERVQNPTKEQLDAVRDLINTFRWQAPSTFSAIMLVVPMNLLKISLNAFFVGLGIYFGKAYTNNLTPSYKSGSLGILIIFVVVSTLSISMYYIPEGFKTLEYAPLARYDRLRRLRVSHEATNARNELGGQVDGLATLLQAQAPPVRVSQSGRSVDGAEQAGHGSTRSTSAAIHPVPHEQQAQQPEAASQNEGFLVSEPTRSSSVPRRAPSPPQFSHADSSMADGAILAALAEFIRCQEGTLSASRRLQRAFEESSAT
ncbi:hypothetical protein K491DRAFT_718241 [Lophiostoma macrostomum CBS 122681]|uniref:Uncharacterized protein n=1 Tax=Lophiostoma macrostomum CBS 122681 TaxID=1314788 RepID=A0A6A6T085_9PLEO|nr:hypothetical protein K491DRAFT_718241 [Lophiostoma macrostomum CBS 122681]